MNILIFGAGGIGTQHAKALSQTKRCDVSCFDLDSTKLAEVEKKVLIRKKYSDLSKINLNEFDGVIIATPTDTHIQNARMCIEAGIPVLIEKPLSVDESGVQAFISDVEKSGVRVGVAFPRRFSSGIDRLKKSIEQREFGKIHLAQTNFSQDFRKYRPDYQHTYYSKLSTGGGIILDALSHHIAVLVYLLGEVSDVMTVSSRLALEGCEGDDMAFICLKFNNGVMASILGNQFQKPNVDRVELVGENGNISYERVSEKLSSNMSDQIDWKSEKISGNWSEILLNQANNFIDGIENGINFGTPLFEAHHCLKIAAAAQQSSRIGSKIRL